MKSAHIKIAAILFVPLCLWTLLLMYVPYSTSLGLFLKVALWGIPAYFFPKLVDSINSNNFLLLNRAPQGKWIYFSVIFLIVYIFLLNGGKVEIKTVSVFYFGAAIVVSPIAEEIAFRGVVLQKLNQIVSFKISNSVTAIWFMVYHIPLWIARGQRVSIMACLWVIFFSLWMGFFLRKSKSLWTCIVIHAAQNLIFGLL